MEIANADVIVAIIFIIIIIATATICIAAAARRTKSGGAAAPRPGRVRGPQSKNAYVSLLFGNGDYLGGILAWAESLIRTRGRAPNPPDIVCMITPDVPAAAREAIAAAGIRAVRIPYTSAPAAGRDCAAWNALSLIEYEKVLYMDADTAAMANIDDLFSLAPPAAAWPRGRPDAGIVLIEPNVAAAAAYAAKGGNIIEFMKGRGATWTHMPDDTVFYWFHDDMYSGKKKKIVHCVGMPKPWAADMTRFPDTNAWAPRPAAAPPITAPP